MRQLGRRSIVTGTLIPPIDLRLLQSGSMTSAAQQLGFTQSAVSQSLRQFERELKLPASTLQFVNALMKANKDFDLVLLPQATHGGTINPYTVRRAWDFFVRNLRGIEPPSPNLDSTPTPSLTGMGRRPRYIVSPISSRSTLRLLL
jgi:hypothetical protein